MEYRPVPGRHAGWSEKGGGARLHPISYAYCLAYGKVPDSLEAVVEARLMSRRYLADDNQQPLRCWREADALVVESTGPEPWTHRWQGLDARR